MAILVRRNDISIVLMEDVPSSDEEGRGCARSPSLSRE